MTKPVKPSAIARFVVKHADLRIGVQVYLTPADVARAYEQMNCAGKGSGTMAFFVPNASNANGTIVLPLAGISPGLIAHELFHAAMHNLRFAALRDAASRIPLQIAPAHEEWLCGCVQTLTDRICSLIESIPRRK